MQFVLEAANDLEELPLTAMKNACGGRMNVEWLLTAW
jgi:hypothetical protein